MAEGMPTYAAVLPGSSPPLIMQRQPLPVQRQYLFGTEAGALGKHHHRLVGLWQQGEDLEILLDGKDDRPLLPLADAFDLTNSTEVRCRSPREAPARR